MHILKSLFRGLSQSLFVFCVLLFPVVTALAVVFHSPDFVLNTIKASGIYNNVVPAVLDKSKENAQGQANQEGTDLLADPEIQAIIKKSVTADTLQRSVDQVAGGFYGWLQGKTTEPQFTIDLTDTRQTLLNNLNAYAVERAAKLPACTPQQLMQMANQGGQTEQDILSISCLPPGLDPKVAAQQFSNDALNNADFLTDPTFSSNELLLNEKGQPVSKQLPWAPDAYRFAMILPWLLGGIGTLCALAVIFLHNRRRRGVQLVGSTLLIIGLLQLAMVAVYMIFFRNIGQVIGDGVQAEFQSAAMTVVSAVAFEFVKISGIIAAVYTVVGFAMVVAELKTREKPVIAPPQMPRQQHSNVLPPVEGKDSSSLGSK